MSQLDKQLEKIQKGLAESSQLYQSSKQKLYENLADAYLWWRKASRDGDYLNKLFEQNDITGRSSGTPNFHMLVRLIFKMTQGTQAAQIANYAYAIRALDEEYESRKFIYSKRENPASELVAFIYANNGIGGLRKFSQAYIDEHGEDYEAERRARKPSQKTLSKRVAAKLLTDAEALRQKKQKAKLAVTGITADFGEVATNDDELVVILAKRNDYSNQLTVIGTTADEKAVDTAILEIGDIDYRQTTQILRTFAEAIKINIIPKRLQAQKVRNKFYNNTKIKIPAIDKKTGEETHVTLKEKTRVVVRKDKTLLISKTPSVASLTTIVKPNLSFGVANDVFLRGGDRYWFETELINEHQILLYTSEPANKLKTPEDENLRAQYLLTLKNSRTKHTRNLYFYDTDAIDREIGFQPSIKNNGEISYDFAVTASASYIRRLNSKHFQKWLYGMNKGVKLKHNLHMQLVFSGKGIEVRSDWQDGKYQQQGNDFLLKYDYDATAKSELKTFTITVSPLDLVQPFATIEHLFLVGKVSIEANANLLHLGFESEIARYDVYIPACDHAGIRDATYFELAYSNE